MSKSTKATGKEAASLGQLIEDVTMLNCEDWNAIMKICDIINSSPDGPKEAIKSFRKRLTAKDPSVLKLTLVVLDSCVTNCGLRFQIQVASRDFLQDFLKLIKPKHSPSTELQTTVLGLLQSWAQTFQGIPELKEVVKTYQELKNKNVEFPPTEPNNLQISVEDTSAGKTYLPGAQTGKTGTSGGSSFMIVPHNNESYSRLSPSGAQRPPPSPVAERKPSLRMDLGEGPCASGASYLIVPQTANAHARLSPGGMRRNKQLLVPIAAERKASLKAEFGEGLASLGASYLLVPHTTDAYARLSPGGIRRQKHETPVAERKSSLKSEILGQSAWEYQRLSPSSARRPDAGPTSSTDRKASLERDALRFELATIKQHCKTFVDLIAVVKMGKVDHAKMQLLQDMEKSCRQMQQRVAQLMGQDENLKVELLGVNDDLTGAFKSYDELLATAGAKAGEPVSADQVTRATADLVDLHVSSSAGVVL